MDIQKLGIKYCEKNSYCNREKCPLFERMCITRFGTIIFPKTPITYNEFIEHYNFMLKEIGAKDEEIST